MSEPRKPISETHDAVIDLIATDEQAPSATLLVKQTFSFAGGTCQLTEPEPLQHDMRDESLRPPLRPGSDFWPSKPFTDVVVQGSAWATGGRKVTSRMVSLRVGEAVKRAAVFGRRALTWGENGPVAQPPEPFEQIPLTWNSAYGGLDRRVSLENEDGPLDPADPLTARMLQSDHPGMYPRNPLGKGYLVLEDAVEGAELPNLEDPDDLLSPDRLLVREPRLWYRQPLPWCYDWVHPVFFPRMVFFGSGVDAWFPGPEDENLPEVRRGFLPAGYRSQMEGRALQQGPDPRFCQEGSAGMVLNGLQGGEPVRVRGMHPEHEIMTFNLPLPPRLQIAIEGDTQEVRPRLHHVVLHPAEQRVYLVWGASRPLTRVFLPGVHRHIPVSAFIDDHAPLAYQAPPTLHDQLEEARRRQKEARRRERRRKKDKDA